MTTAKQVAIRLKPEGGPEVVRAFKEAEQAGVGAANATAQAADRATSAYDRQVQKLQALATAAQSAASAERAQGDLNRLLGVRDGPSSAARASADVFMIDDDMEQRARRVKAAMDPLWAATDKYNDELRELNQLQMAGKLSATEFAQAQALAKSRLDDATAAAQRNTNGLTRLQLASRLNLTRQAADVAVTAAMGMNPAMIAMQQGPQILDAWATSGLKARGAMVLLGGSVAAAAAGAAVLGAAYLAGERDFRAMDSAAAGLGRTAGLSAEQLEMLAGRAAEAGRVSEASAERMAAAFVSTGQIGGAEIERLIALSRDFAAFTGVDAADAQTALAKAMEDPEKAARAMTSAFGLLTDAQMDQMLALEKVNDRTGQQKLLLEAMEGAMRGHADRVDDVTGAWEAATRALSNYWNRFNEWLYTTPTEAAANSIQLNQLRAQIQRDLGNDRAADRYEREAGQTYFNLKRDGLQDRIDQTEAQQNQRDLAAREAREEEARRSRGGRRGPDPAVAARRAQREALQRSRGEEDREASVQIEVARLSNQTDLVQQLQDEADVRRRMRQLIDDEVKAEDAKTRAWEEQNRIIAAREQAQDREAGRLRREFDIEIERMQGRDRIAEQWEREVELAARVEEYTRRIGDADQARSLANADQLEIDQARADLREREVRDTEALRQIDLARRRGDDDTARLLQRRQDVEDRAREIEKRGGLNRGEGEAQARREMEEQWRADAIGGFRSWTKDFVQQWRSSGFGDAVREQLFEAGDRWLNRIIDRLWEMDWSALFSRGGSGGQGGGWMAAAAAFLGAGRNADGTEHWRGGLSWVGENGPELLNLPRGSQVIEHNRSMALAGAMGGGQKISVNVTVPLTLPPGFVPERQLLALLNQASDAGAMRAVKIIREGGNAAQVEWQMDKGF